MAPVSTTFTIDPVLKKEAQELLDRLGLNLSTAVNMFLRQAVREQALPFPIGNLMPNSETMRSIEESIQNINMSSEYDTVDEMWKDLEADESC